MKHLIPLLALAAVLIGCGTAQAPAQPEASCATRIDLDHVYIDVGQTTSHTYLRDGIGRAKIQWTLTYKDGRVLHGGDNLMLRRDADGRQIPDVISFGCTDGTITAKEVPIK